MKKLILSIDQGTTSSRSILFDLKGRKVFSSQYEFQQIFPKPGWVEHNPEEIWKVTLKTIKESIKKSKKLKAKVISIGITNQRETTVDAVQSALRTFTSISSDNNLSLFNNFLSVCSGKSIPSEEMKSLDEMGLTKNSELSPKGKEILRQMKLQPKVMKKKIVSSKDKPQFLDDLLGEL